MCYSLFLTEIEVKYHILVNTRKNRKKILIEIND